MLDIQIQGEKELARAFAKISRELGKTEVLLRRIAGEVLRAELTRSMTNGTDPEGQPLATVERWTRTIRLGTGAAVPRGKLTPLVATGSLRAKMGTIRVSTKELEFGYKGKTLKIATAMKNGTPGFMAVKDKSVKDAYSGIRIADDGHDYARIATGANQWITKQISGRNKISIRPKKRDFFFLSQKMTDKAVAVALDFIDKAIA